MENEQIQQLVVRAVQQAYDAWAMEHPSLAAVIDRITLTEQATESLRNSPQFAEAMNDIVDVRRRARLSRRAAAHAATKAAVPDEKLTANVAPTLAANSRSN